MKRFLFFIAAVFTLLVIRPTPGWAEDPLSLKWMKIDFTYERICKPGKLIVASKNGDHQYLIDWTNGEVLYKTKPDSNELGIYINYYGDKFYVFLYGHGKNELQEYETKTKKYLRTIFNGSSPMSPNEERAGYNPETKSFAIYHAFTKELIDSLYHPVNLNINNGNVEFTPDSKYILFTLIEGIIPYIYLLDRTNREFLFEGKKDFKYCLFNKSNKMAYAENMKLPGDDTIYSYIRIYDPDQRKVIQDIKIGKFDIHYLSIKSDDNIIIFELDDGKYLSNFLNLNASKISDYKASVPQIMYSDDSMLYCAPALAAYQFDWSVSVKSNTPIEETNIYPNPADNKITVNIPEDYYSGTWQICDIAGKIMMKGIILPQPALQIDVSRLLPQTYYLTIKKDNIVESFKFIKD